jgi:hypothetical protein
MNVFMPCASVIESTQSLDDLRLKKQILECKVLLDGAIAYKNGEKPNGYFKHPVAQHYKDYPAFLAFYGLACCNEYFDRFDKLHNYNDYFRKYAENFLRADNVYMLLYAEGRKNTPECIRETDNEKVYELFKNKLNNKWLADIEKGRPPKWTKRGKPEWAVI